MPRFNLIQTSNEQNTRRGLLRESPGYRLSLGLAGLALSSYLLSYAPMQDKYRERVEDFSTAVAMAALGASWATSSERERRNRGD